MIGQTLGPYEVVAKLGEGGMGEVYRARDTRLGRDVAVKVLSGATTTDPAAAARFDREARAIASLNHPNICALYDVGLAAGRTYLVMELLEGETLYQRLARGPVEPSLLVDLSIALADGLEAAHARGLIHRDLKPANIFLTRHGQVKILDFGLAKAVDTPDDETRAADAPITSPGSAVGTIAYMSPEQLRGSAIDARSDLFSLGVVLYEMATGQRAFQGATTAVISAAILHDEPAAPCTLNPSLPAKFEEAILKAIEKDRDLRYQTAAELRTDLKRLKRAASSDERARTAESGPAARSGSSSARSSAGPSAPLTPAVSSDSQIVLGIVKRHRVKVAIGVIATIATMAAGGWWFVQDRAPARPGAIDIQTLTVVGDACCAGISPDGRFVAFARTRDGRSGVWVRQMSNEGAVEIVPAVAGRDIRTISITPDASFVDFVAREPGAPAFDAWRVALLGGQPHRVIPGVWSGLGWSPDGGRVAFIRRAADGGSTALMVANGDGSNERVVATRQGQTEFVNINFRIRPIAHPVWSADGRSLYVIGITRSPERARNPYEIAALDAGTGAERRVMPINGGGYDLARLDDAHLLVNRTTLLSNPQIWRWNTASPDMTPLLHDLASFFGLSLTADRTRGVALRTDSRSGVWLGAATGEAMTQIVDDSPAVSLATAVDRDGFVYYSAALPDGHNAIYRAAPTRGSDPVLIAERGGLPRLTADGRSVFFVRGDPTQALMRVSRDGSNLATILEDPAMTSPAVTPDGRTLYFTSTQGGTYTLWSMPAAAGGTPRALGHTGMGVRFTISPDGRTGGFIDRTRTVVLCDLPDCRNVRPAGVTELGTFTPDGRGFAYIPRDDPKNIWVQPFDGAAKPLTTFTDKYQANTFAFSVDGSRLVVTRGVTTSDIVMIKGLR